MRVYIAAPYAAREFAKAYATGLELHGHEVVSRWIDETQPITPGTINAATDLDDQAASEFASTDLWQVATAEVFVALTAKHCGVEGGSGGRHVEMGYFLASNSASNVIVVGEPENIFHRLADVTVVPSEIGMAGLLHELKSVAA